MAEIASALRREMKKDPVAALLLCDLYENLVAVVNARADANAKLRFYANAVIHAVLYRLPYQATEVMF